jgi:hypothetical protein
MNQDRLRSAYEQNEAVRAICDHMAARDRNQTETKLRRILRHLTNDGVDLRRSEVIAAFRELEETGCGKYVEGRHGWPSRFVWDVKSLGVSAAARGTQPIEATPEDDAGTEDSDEAEFIEHSFVLRPDLTISVELPTDLTETEAARLAAFIQSLPFEQVGYKAE